MSVMMHDLVVCLQRTTCYSVHAGQCGVQIIFLACVCTLAVSDRQQPGQIKSKGVRSAAGKSVRSNEIEERCASSRCAGKRGDPARPRVGLRVQGGGLSVMRDGGDEGRVETFWQLLLGLKYRNTVVLDFQD